MPFMIKQILHILSVTALVLMVVAPLALAPAQAQMNPLQSTVEFLGVENPLLIKTGITQALEVGKIGKHKFEDAPGMKAFYAARDYQSVWLQSSFLRQRKAETLLKTFESSWKHGLNPNHYHVNEIRRLMSEAKGVERFQLDLILSDALVRYGRDLTGMRINPRVIGQRSKYWRQPLRGIDTLDHVAGATNTKLALDGLAPKGKLYKKLQQELVRLYKTPANDPREKPIHLKGILRPGSGHKTILAVRERMGFKAEEAPQGAYTYDDQLAQAVMAFQKAHGLTPDGIVGAHTVKLMNMTREDRLNQVLANLERLRWVEPNKPERYIMVNVPSAMLWAVENGQVKLEMPVVVGRVKRPTNIFSTQITGVRFNPTWTVPPTIKKEDYLPKLQENPYYLSDRGIELMDVDNMSVDPGLVNWNEKTWQEVNQMRMVQGSGRSNPLGLVRVIMNNPFNIYLHDTPKKSYFKRANRALSSGCIRLLEAQQVADFILARNDNWSKERKDKILARGRLAEVRAQKPLPVYILYQTVWLGDREQIVYGHDLYGHDRKLLKALSDIGGIALPEARKNTKTAQNNVSKDVVIDLLRN